MFDAFRKKLARTVEEESEEPITFKPFDEKNEFPSASEEPAPAPMQNSSIEGNNIELKVIRPESIDEIFSIADYLISGCTVVLNLELLGTDIVTRMLDFLNGVTYTTGGEMKNVSPGTYIITPNGININK